MPARGSMFSFAVLDIDAGATAAAIVGAIRAQVLERLKHKGVVVGLSGSIDSSMVATLAVTALGPCRVVALLMTERDSAGESLALGRLVAGHLGIEAIVEDITPVLAGAG